MTDEDRLKDLYNECIHKLNNIGYYPSVSKIFFNTRTHRRLGAYYVSDMSIEISHFMFKHSNDSDIKRVIMHELSHNLDHIINGKIDECLRGHGKQWLKIAEDVGDKLGIKIERFTNIGLQNAKANVKNHYIIKCYCCGHDQTITSKFDTYEKSRTPRCESCNSNSWELVAKGQYGFDLKTNSRIIIYDK